MTEKENSDVVQVGEVARRMGLSIGAVYVAARSDSLPFPTFRVGKRFVIPRQPFEKFLCGEVPSDRAA